MITFTMILGHDHRVKAYKILDMLITFYLGLNMMTFTMVTEFRSIKPKVGL